MINSLNRQFKIAWAKRKLRIAQYKERNLILENIALMIEIGQMDSESEEYRDAIEKCEEMQLEEELAIKEINIMERYIKIQKNGKIRIKN